MKTTYSEDPKLLETFIDHVHSVSVSDNVARIVGAATRMDEPKQGAEPTARQYAVGRWALTLPALLQLQIQINLTVQNLEKQGLLKIQPAPNPTPNGPRH
jgi:hypothetical protein